MIYEIPYDSKIALPQYKLRLWLAFKKNLNRTAINAACAGFVILTAWDMLDKRLERGYFFMAAGFYFLFNVINYLLYYRKTSKKYTLLHREIADLREKNKDVCVWEFRDDVLKFKDMYYDNSVRWEAFKGYRIVKGNLFLVLVESIDQSFILGEKEIGAAEFARVVDFVKRKMRLLPD